MSKCNWDPAKHGGRECPIHGAGGSMWDENILTKQDKINKLKEKGYTEDEIEEELKGVGFDDDFDFDDDYERSWGPIIDEEDEAEIDEMIGDEEYAYGGLKSKEDLVNALVNRGKIDENIAKAYVTKHWDEYNKHFNNENASSDDKPYNFDEWANKTNSKKEEHIGYIDTNKTYKPEEIMEIVSSDDGWDVIAGNSYDGNVWFKHDAGPHYVWNRKDGKIKLLSKNATKRYEGIEQDKEELPF